MAVAALHSRTNPSGAKVWTDCTASVGYIAANESALPADDSSVYSKEGESAHAIAANCLCDPSLTPVDPFLEVNSHLAICKHRKEEFKPTTPGGWYMEGIEGKVPLFYAPKENGTVDYWVAGYTGLAVVDLKWGKGVYVEEKENFQLAIYARSLLKKLVEQGQPFADDDTAVASMTIVQPRCLRAGKPIAREWRITFAELKDFVLKVSDAVLAIKTNDTSRLKFAPSESNCQFCRARHLPCEAMRAAAMKGIPADVRKARTPAEIASVLPDLDADPAAGGVPKADLVEVFRSAPLIRSYLGAVEEILVRRASKGPVEGLKWVAGREGNRTWIDEKHTEDILGPIVGTALWDTKLISPAKAETLLKKEMTKTELKSLMDAQVRREPAKPSIAVEEDPRPALPIHDSSSLHAARAEAKIAKLPVLA